MTSSATNLYSFNATTNKREQISLAQYKGQVVVVVNTASKCGFTKQYAGLESLYKKYKDDGLVVVGFPCNQFMNQEPGSDENIADFCSTKYDVTFPLMGKIDVNGPNAHPLYEWMKSQKKQLGLKRIKWNFEKFIFNRSGELVDRVSTLTTPQELEKIVGPLLNEK